MNVKQVWTRAVNSDSRLFELENKRLKLELELEHKRFYFSGFSFRMIRKAPAGYCGIGTQTVRLPEAEKPKLCCL